MVQKVEFPTPITLDTIVQKQERHIIFFKNKYNFDENVVILLGVVPNSVLIVEWS